MNYIRNTVELWEEKLFASTKESVAESWLVSNLSNPSAECLCVSQSQITSCLNGGSFFKSCQCFGMPYKLSN